MADEGNKYQFGKFLAGGAQDMIRRNAVDRSRAYLQNPGIPMHLSLLKSAIDMPAHLRARINAWIAQYDAANGAGSAQTLMAECLALFNEGKTTAATLAQFNSRLTAMENYATGLVAQAPSPYGDNSLTWTGVANDLIAQVDYIPNILSRFPAVARTDIWGE